MVYQLLARQWVAMDRDAVYQFFADPGNLGRLSPPWVKLKIVSGADSPIVPDQILRLRVRPFGWPMTFKSEITRVETGALFVDCTCGGLFKQWTHEHHFTARDNGTVIEDIVRYELKGGIIGRLLHEFIIGRQLLAMFRYRHSRFDELHGLASRQHPAHFTLVTINRVLPDL